MVKTPNWKKFAFPVFLIVVVGLGIAGARLALRDPQAHAHGKVEQMFFQPVEAYDFELTDHNGRPAKLSQYRGKTVFFAFGFTHCPSICPATLAHFVAIKEALPADVRDKVQFLFVSVDPQRDSPERLKEWVTFFDPDFIGLTGDTTKLRGIAYKYKATYTMGRPAADDPKNYQVDHSADAYLIGPDGKWMMSYPFEELPKAHSIAGDIAKVAAQPGK
jgi:protein SCO1/2